MGLLGSLGSLNVLLSADTAQFSSAMDKAAFQAEQNLRKISRSAKLNSAIITAAVLAAGTAIIVNVKKTIDEADKVGDKMSQALGMTSEQLTSLQYAAKLSGLGIEELSASFKRFNKTVFDESNGILINNISAFKALGIEIKTNSGNLKSNYDLLLETADALSKMKDGVEKAAIAQTLFGKSGSVMVPLLNQGSEGIKELAQQAKEYGIIIEQDTARASARFNDNMTRMASVTQGLVTQFTAGMIPSLASLTDNIHSSTEALQGFREAGKAVGDIVNLLNAAMTANVLQSKIIKGDWQGILNMVLDKLPNVKTSITDTTTALDGFNRKMTEGKTLTDSVRTAQEVYNDSIQKYKDMLSDGTITQETYNRAVAKAKKDLQESTEKTNGLKKAAQDFGMSFQSAFEDAIIDGEKFSTVLSSLLEDIERIILRTAVTTPLANSLSTAISSFFGSTSAHGNIFSNGNLIPFASGGIISRPTIFPMANGGVGLAGEAGDEGILPLFRDSNGDLGVKSGGQGDVEINVYAPEGSSVKTSSQKTGNKNQISIMIDEAVANSINSSGSKTYKAMKSTFGLKQTLTAR